MSEKCFRTPTVETKETGIVEEKVDPPEVSMTNRIMFTEVVVTGEKRMNTQPHQSSQNSNGQKTEGQTMTGNNMEFHKSREVVTRPVSDDNTGVLEPERKTQNILKEDLKRESMTDHRRRDNDTQVIRCNRKPEVQSVTLREGRNRESITEVINHQNTPEVDFETIRREELKW